MQPSSLRLTVVQDTPVPRDLDQNLARVRAALTSDDAELIVFPELFLSGYQTENLGELALRNDDPRILELAAACRASGTAVLVGYIEAVDGGFMDAYLAIDNDGTVLAAVRKTHLFGSERAVFLRGDTLEPITLCGTRIGVINCFEIEFPEVARTLALRGAEILIAGSANMHPYELDHRTAATARALENRLPLAYSNRVGSESGHDFCGSSRVITRDGALLGSLDTESAGTVTVTVELGGSAGGPTDMLAQLRPELYAR